MAVATHTPGVVFGPLVVHDHIRNDYLTTPTKFEDFPPVVESPYFLGVIPVVLPTTFKAHEASKAKEEPQAQEANLIQMFTTYAINFTNTPTIGKNRRRKSSKKPTTCGISSSGKTVRVGDLRIHLDGSETLKIPERNVATVPVKNNFGILPKVRHDKPSFKVKDVKKQWVKVETKNNQRDKFGFKKYRANVGKNEIYSPPRVKQVWVTKEEAQELRKTKALESLVGRKNVRTIMKQDPTMWQTFRRRRVPEREREPSQESRTKECTPSVPVDLQKGSKRKGVYKERRQASPETWQNFKSEEHKRDDDVPRKSVFQRLGATVRSRQKKRRTVQITEEGMRIYTCYASNINLPAIADQAETSNMEQHPTISNRRREQARAWLDQVNVEVDLPHQNEGDMGAADIATTSSYPLDQGRPAENPNIRVEGSVVHIMKALASHPSAALSLIEDDSLQLLFQMVANGSLTVFARFREGLVPLHTIQLHRHAMQILGLLLVNDNGSTAKYIHKRHLIKILLMAVKDFDPENGDSAYTMGIVDLLLECVELSYRLEAGSIRLREDIHNAHGYHFLVQFALKLSSLQKSQVFQSLHPKSSSEGNFGTESSHPSPTVTQKDFASRGDNSPPHLSPSLSRLLDVLINLAQTGPLEPATSAGGKGSKSSYGKSVGHSRSRTPSVDKIGDEIWEKGNTKVRDLEAIQMLQDIFLKADNIDLQAEVLNRMFKIFSSHLENYKLCQQLRTMPLFILNMAAFPTSLQEIILKILEYAVTVVNCVPEQELLSLCCLLQQPITSSLKHTILSFFVKLISFDQQYKKVLREVGVLEVLIDDLKEHKFISGEEQQNKTSVALERKSSSDSFKKHLDSKDAILSSPKLMGSSSGRFHVFEDEGTIAVAWDCLVSLLKKADASQSVFRSANGFTTVLPFLVSHLHRSGVLRMLSCLIIEDAMQEQPLKASSGMRSTFNGQHSGGHTLHLFSVGAMDDTHTFYAEFTLQDNGVFTLSTSNSCSLSFPSVELEEGRWHHLAVVHSKPNSLAGLFQPSVSYLYLDGKLRHTGKLGYSLSPVGKALQVTMGTPVARARASELSWRLRCCYLFEEVLTSGSICFMYILGRGYRGIFQDTDLLQFVPNQACGGGSMSILDSLDADLPVASNMQRLDSTGKQGSTKVDGSGVVWDFERLGNLSVQLSGKKLIFAFDGTSSGAFGTSGTRSLLNLVDPMSSAASPIGGIPRFGRLYGDIYVCHQCPIGDSIRSVGGITVILALIEAAETREMLHMALTLLACALHQNPQNVQDMQAYRGYHLLAIFLHRRMSLFDMQSLDIFFQIAACEASFSEQQKLSENRISSSAPVTPDASFEDLSLPKFSDETSSTGSHGEFDDFSAQKDSFSRLSEFEGSDLHAETSNCIVLSNADMVEHVLLDWTLWVTAPVSIQLALLGFLERMVSMHWYRNHNLTILRRINLVQHLLVTLQRGDVDVRVLEKLVVLLGVILEDGFLTSELELVVRFVIMTFDPPELASRYQILRESMGKHVIVRNMLLEMLIELQETIRSEDLLEQWHKIVSSKLVTYFFDEAVHPTSMRWIMTLLGVCLASSPTFALKFRNSGGYQGLTRVLPSFYDSPEIYYILFCLIFGKTVYPRVPEVRMGDFHSLMPGDGSYTELKFIEMLDSVISMTKSTFDRLSIQSMHAHQSGNISNLETLVAELVAASDNVGDLQGEALMHKTSARLMGGEAAAPAAATSVLRFMVDLAKMSPPFSAICRRIDFLESCVDLYFSCVRADCAVKMAKDLLARVPDEKIMDATDDNRSSRHTFSSLPQEVEQSSRTSISIESYPPAQKSASSGGMSGMQKDMSDDNTDRGNSPRLRLSKSVVESIGQSVHSFDTESIGKISSFSSCTHDLSFRESNGNIDTNVTKNSFNSASLTMPNSPVSSEKSNSKMFLTPSSSPVIALTSWLGSRGNQNEAKIQPNATISVGSSVSVNEFDASPDLRVSSQGSTAANLFFPVNPKLLLEIDDSGYGGGPCSAAATAILDFIAVVLADIVSEQIKASQYVEGILETVPMFVDIDSALVFQGLCLSRLMNFLESRLIRDDEEDEKRLDKSRWSVNLDFLCSMIVDRVYMGAFPHPCGALRTLEFLLSMLQLANKDGRIEEALPAGNVLLSITRANRQLEPYVQSLLKSTNRMVMYCFLPLFLTTIQEDGFLSRLGFHMESMKGIVMNASNDESAIDICTVLQLLVAHKRLILCPSNLDNDLMCCLCVNLISLLHDRRQTAQNLAVDVTKFLLLHRRSALEELLVSKPNQGLNLDVLHGGFDKLLTGGTSSFFDWFQISEHAINKVLEQCAVIMWVQYIAGAAKFPGIRIKGMESRRKKEMGRKLRDTSRLDLRHWEQINERRYALELVRESMSTELRVIRQDKYGWVLHAESEWQTHLLQLIHERGILPVRISSAEPEWQLCPIEGPYRMRKKLERCKLKIDTIQNVLRSGLELECKDRAEDNYVNDLDTSESESEPFFNLIEDGINQDNLEDSQYNESFFKGADELKGEDSVSNVGWNDDQASSINESSLHSAAEFGAKSSVNSVQITDSFVAKSDSSPRQSSSMKIEDVIAAEDRSEKEIHDNGEYLIRPFLEPMEKIRFKYNCERVVGLDKHDGIFLIGDLCLYIIENFYIDDTGCICEKESEDGLSVIDKALGVKKDVTCTNEFQLKSPSSWGTTVKTLVGGRAWAYSGGAWGKEKVCTSSNIPHPWHMWKLDSVHELLKRDYQLRPVAIEIFSMDGCNDLLVFHKKEREEVFKNLVAMNLPRNSMLDTTISGSTRQESNEGSRLFKTMAKSFSKRWQNGEISNFQYLMHLNTLAGRGYSDLTQYPVFPWVLADYESETLDLTNPQSFRKLDMPMGCQTAEGEEEFRKRYESWDDPDVPKFHYGSHYSSAGIVLFYLLRLPPFSIENQKLQGGQFDHADRLFNGIRDTWFSAAGKGNTSDVKELIPEFFYMPEFLENRFNLDLGEKQSGEKVGDVVLPPWAKNSAREFIRKHREALESDYVSENLHHWIDLIFGYKQRGKVSKCIDG
ncbi:hypothetical protein Taro_012522 [Colocasia esculenta]|uniref:Uncharacterized protein n=1 Tax=Colocasia esculenta TaxID=4460 RepID=A0A843U9B6_COLES|nr:hypothetical protein [Colocasia esculenta]